MEIEEGLIHAIRGNAVLFTGAGFSYKALNACPPPENKIPDARTFARQLTAAFGASGDYDLPIISQYYIEKKGEHNLLQEIARRFTTVVVEEFHIIVASIPWRRVYTTNYDNCFEHAALQKNLEWNVITTDYEPSAKKKLCVHINGHITNLTIKNLSTQIKLTHSSYSADSFALSKWSQQFRQDINNAKSLFFIGYSLSDIDVARILYSSPDLCDRTFFVVAPHADEIVTAPLRKFGSVHPIGIEAFAELAKTIVVPVDVSSHSYSWLMEYNSDTVPEKPEDKDGIDLLTLGVVEQPHVIWSLAENNPQCYVKRTELYEILSEIDKGRRWFLIHSDIGNGKTIIKHQLSHLLSRKGFTVFWDTDFDLNRAADLREIGSEERNIVVFIDESSDRFDIIDGLMSLNIPNIVVAVCVRTTLYELGESKYEDYLPSDYLPVDVNRLSDDNVNDFVYLLNLLGLWGEKADISDAEKRSFIHVNCRGSISKIILSIFEQSEIGKRIVAESQEIINSRDDSASLIILSFLVNRIGHPPRLTLLSEILNMDAWAIVRSERFRKAGEFIRFRDGLVKARSPIVSTYLLRKSLKPETLIFHIHRFVRRLASLRRDQTIHHIFTELQRFPILESLIESSRGREIIIGYFQSLKDLPYCQNNSLFWLHYAMARLSYGEFKEATLYFEQARSLAKGKPKETIDVNNHFARLLLDSRTNSSDYDDYFNAFEMAHQILIDQMNRNTNRHFPFRQAKKYVEFIAYRKKQLTQSQVDRFMTSCKQVVSAINHLHGRIARAREVEECREAMNRALEIAQTAD